MKTLGMVTWSVSEEHTHTVFGNKNVKDGKIVPTTDNDCKVSLKTMLMNEDVFKDVIALEAWSCFYPSYKKCTINHEDNCKHCDTDKNGMYCTVI